MESPWSPEGVRCHGDYPKRMTFPGVTRDTPATTGSARMPAAAQPATQPAILLPAEGEPHQWGAGHPPLKHPCRSGWGLVEQHAPGAPQKGLLAFSSSLSCSVRPYSPPGMGHPALHLLPGAHSRASAPQGTLLFPLSIQEAPSVHLPLTPLPAVLGSRQGKYP